MKIVALDGSIMNPGDLSWDRVAQLGELTVHDITDSTQTIERCQHADVVLTNKVTLDRAVLDQLPNLKFISVTATGFNNVDIEYARQKGIPVSNVPVYSTLSVAQHVFASLLTFIHRVEHHDSLIRDGKWHEAGRFSFWDSPLTELHGKTMGIVGLGRIGMATAKLADAFGMNVIAYRRNRTVVPDFKNFCWAEIPELFSAADVVSLHCPQTQDNAGFVKSSLLMRMKPNSILINTARGGLVNERDLANALNEGRIAGAVLDVLSSEPPGQDNPLLAAKNCLLTPHLAWTTFEARKRLMDVTAENIEAFLAGQTVNIVN